MTRLPLDPVDAGALRILADDDPARLLILEILSVIRVSHWSFARFKSHGVRDQLLSSADASDQQEEFNQLREEFVLQRERTTKGPRLSATLRSLHTPYVSGITLVFADMRRDFGVLSLLRADDLGPFSSFEIRALALALDASADRLSGLSLSPPAMHAPLTRDAPAMHVLDADLNVVLTWGNQDGERSAAITAAQTRLQQRLPPIIEKAVHDLVASWTSDPSTQTTGAARPVPFLTVRTQPLVGSKGLFVGVLLERSPGADVFDTAARAFNISTRELETLAMLLQGAKLSEIAQALHIMPSTVQDHIKNLLDKTGARNRSEMIAKVLNLRSGAT